MGEAKERKKCVSAVRFPLHSAWWLPKRVVRVNEFVTMWWMPLPRQTQYIDMCVLANFWINIKTFPFSVVLERTQKCHSWMAFYRENTFTAPFFLRTQTMFGTTQNIFAFVSWRLTHLLYGIYLLNMHEEMYKHERRVHLVLVCAGY